jgi:hypothetical protein
MCCAGVILAIICRNKGYNPKVCVNQQRPAIEQRGLAQCGPGVPRGSERGVPCVGSSLGLHGEFYGEAVDICCLRGANAWAGSG